MWLVFETGVLKGIICPEKAVSGTDGDLWVAEGGGLLKQRTSTENKTGA